LNVPDIASRATDTGGSVASGPADVVRRFLLLLEDGHIEAATELLAEDVRYQNASLPTIRGRERTRRALTTTFGRPSAGFEVYFHAISADGPTVLTERTDVLIFGPVRIQIWVCGRFDVEDGEIVHWKDYFDWGDTIVATIRGLIGAVVPSLRAKPPSA
jgi:limonene-1,2-epoxide hydrolase